tara:strand:- start:97 stop:342 length:246 start_codon:yes stop_codon:yes gene_type:complete
VLRLTPPLIANFSTFQLFHHPTKTVEEGVHPILDLSIQKLVVFLVRWDLDHDPFYRHVGEWAMMHVSPVRQYLLTNQNEEN